MTLNKPDRVPRYEGFWWQAERDFHAQGVPTNVSMPDFFGFDLRLLDCDTSPQLETQVLEATDEFVTFRDHYGYLQTEFRDRQTTPRLLEPPVVTREDWDRKYRELARPGLHRVDLEKRKSEYNEWRKQGRYIALSSLDPFESVWHLVGPDRQLTLMLDDPEWLWEMYEVTTDCILGTLEIYLEEGMEVDGVMLWGDIAYRSGPMFSPRCYESVLMPHHKRIADRIHQLGGQLIYHTDGDFRPLMELMLSAGINCFHPLEVKAGLDVRQMLRDYGHRCAFFGNIDARLFQANNLDGLRKEISEKLTVAMEYGGYIFHSDHSIPPGCKLATYEAALELVEELGVYAAKAV